MPPRRAEELAGSKLRRVHRVREVLKVRRARQRRAVERKRELPPKDAARVRRAVEKARRAVARQPPAAAPRVAAKADAANRPLRPRRVAGAVAAAVRTAGRRVEVDRRGVRRGRRPAAARPSHDEWPFGDIEAGFKEAALVLDETFVGQNTSHQVLEPRSAMAYWQNGKLFLHAGTQSTVQTVGSIARWVGIPASDVVLISEYTGGGFGSRIPGYIAMAIPALLSKKANAPVMMRITREDDHYIGRARPALHSRAKVGFAKDGRITALDFFVVAENGPYDQVGDGGSAGDDHLARVSAEDDAVARRCRCSPTRRRAARSARRAACRASPSMEPILAKAARQAGHRRGRDPQDQRAGRQGAVRRAEPRAASSSYVTSAFVKEALDKGAEIFNWEEKKARSGKRVGTKVRGSGVAVSTYSAGSTGFDGLLIVRPDGKVQIQSGVGNLGTHAMFDVHRVAAEILGVAVGTVRGRLRRHEQEPAVDLLVGRQPDRARDDARRARRRHLRQDADSGSRREDARRESRELSGGRTAACWAAARSMTFAQVAQKAIELGGKYDGHEPPEDVNNWTKTSMKNLAGQGLIAAARDNYPRDGQSRSFVVGFAEVEVDVETGAVHDSRVRGGRPTSARC